MDKTFFASGYQKITHKAGIVACEIMIQKLLEYLNKRKKEIINPDNLTFEDIGFDNPEDFPTDVTIDEFLEQEEDLNEYKQAQLSIIQEIIEYVKSKI